ncbi:MAG: endolytic transglycosylase MltG [Brooklawnia sp.]|uniref:endolytic transglycosylase MltG n=1 Tax=Brooklawnia sp. TaxID=2699740 RepID=UPI003C769780
MSRFLDEDPEVGRPHDTEDEVDFFDHDPDSAEPLPPPVKRPGSWLKNVLAVGISLAVLIGGGYFVVSRLTDGYLNFATVQDYPGPGEEEVLVEIPTGATLTDIAELLVEYDVVKSSRAFINAAQDTPNSASIQPGTYRMMTQMRAADAVNTLLNLENLVRDQVTIPEGWRNSEVVQRLAEATGIPVADFEAELADPVNLTLPGWAEGRTEGFLYPETYTFGAEPTAAEILTLMTSQFNTVTEALDFVTRAEELGMSPFDAVTIASIIERETRDPAYGPDVAQVIYNRLRADMELQMDSTVHYANDTSGQVTTTDEERGINSPYNTYRYKGLPPGAISNPGEWALSSAVNPSSGDYLYFVTVDVTTGETRFAETFEEHEENVALFQQSCRDNPDHC